MYSDLAGNQGAECKAVHIVCTKINIEVSVALGAQYSHVNITLQAQTNCQRKVVKN